MTRKKALSKFIKDMINDNCRPPKSEIDFMKKALDWYGCDDIDDENYTFHLVDIFDLYKEWYDNSNKD